jgi:hypothetical protein
VDTQPDRPNERHARWLYYLAAGVFILLGYAVGWLEKSALVWPSFATALVCIILANLDRVSSIKAGGIDLVLREAKAAVRESRELALVTAKMLLSLVQRAGRLGGYPTEQQNEIREAVDRVLQKFDATDAEKREAYSDWDALVRVDYAFGILGHQLPKFPQGGTAGQKAWKALRERTSTVKDVPSADELADFLKTYGVLE